GRRPQGSVSVLAADDPEVLNAVLDSLPMGVYLVDRHGKILLWNSAAERITGHLRQNLLGQSAQEGFISHTDSDDNDVDHTHLPLPPAMRQSNATGTASNLPYKVCSRMHVRPFASPIRNSHGSVIAAVESFVETSSAAKWTERRSNLADYGCIDEASGVLTHEMIALHLRENLALFAEKPVPFSVVCIAIDHLDDLKRRDGSAVLGPALHVFGLTLRNSLRPTEFVGRWRENEFLAILTECTAEGVAASGERLRRVLSQVEIEWWGDSVKLTASLGCATTKPGDDVESLVARAESALLESASCGDSVMVCKS